jgi:methylase of polypeptide subunit release factors
MRLANLEKAGYFPIPPSVTELVSTYIAAPHGGRILDPCAGEGVALVTLADALTLEPFGVELHEGRAQAARQAVDKLLEEHGREQPAGAIHVLQDSYQSLLTSRDGYNFLYLNPPYDRRAAAASGPRYGTGAGAVVGTVAGVETISMNDTPIKIGKTTGGRLDRDQADTFPPLPSDGASR